VSLTRAAAEDFLFHEARLLDETRYDEWLALFLPDAYYWVPCRPEQPDPLEELSLVYDDFPLMQARVAQIRHPQHYSNIPGVRASRHVSNVRVSDHTVHSKLLMITAHGDSQSVFSATVTHELREVEGALRIVSKKVLLVNCDAGFEALLLPF
jgi:3-phenylpropionate/cinnamic acid dioxygenase small subunit